MLFTGRSCSYCDISAKDSYRAFFIRLSPCGEYLIICDGCLARERRHLLTEGPGLAGASSSTPLGEESVRRLTSSMSKALLAATQRSIEHFPLPRIHDWPVISTLYRSYKRFS